MIKFDFESYNNINFENANLSGVMEKFLSDDKMLGWYNFENKDNDEIIRYSKYIRNNCDVFIVIGIGGSFLGSKAIIDLFTPYFNRNNPEIIFAGNNLSSDYINDLLKYIDDKKVCINVISKSGNTLETLISFNVLLKYMKNKYSDFRNRIFVTTNLTNGKLLNISKENNFKVFGVPLDIPGRYSVLSIVGLLPIAVANIDINKLLNGALECKNDLKNCFKYTYLRNKMQKSNYFVESFDFYEPKFYYFGEWIKQLYAESQGKNSKAIFPVSTINTRDLHSMEQYYKGGRHVIFSTTIFVNLNEKRHIMYNSKDLNNINKIVMTSVLKTRKDIINTSLIELDSINEKDIGYLIFFFEVSAMLGSYLINVNYYDQPAVNDYKNAISELV